MRKLNKAEKRFIASKKIAYLCKLALKAKDSNLAKNAVKTAKRLSTKFRVQISKNFKRRYCKYCYSIFNSANNVSVRIKKNLVQCHCLSCGRYSRFPFTKEKKLKKSK